MRAGSLGAGAQEPVLTTAFPWAFLSHPFPVGAFTRFANPPCGLSTESGVRDRGDPEVRGLDWVPGLRGTSLKLGCGDLRVEAVFLFQAEPSGDCHSSVVWKG